SLIAQPEDATDLSLSDRVREAALAGVLAEDQVAGGTSPNELRASAAVALSATLDQADLLTTGERGPLRELLDRLSGQAVSGPFSPRREVAQDGRRVTHRILREQDIARGAG